MSLWQDFLTNGARPMTKWAHYFPIYERYLSDWRDKSLTFLEISVFEGGSLQMWKRYLGPHATIVGVDVNPGCKDFEKDNVHVRIGDQGDPAFLNDLVDEFGEFDIVIDDGSHRMEHVLESFISVYKDFVDELNAEHTRGAIEPTFMTCFTRGIHFHDSVIVFERGSTPLRKSLESP